MGILDTTPYAPSYVEFWAGKLFHEPQKAKVRTNQGSPFKHHKTVSALISETTNTSGLPSLIWLLPVASIALFLLSRNASTHNWMSVIFG